MREKVEMGKNSMLEWNIFADSHNNLLNHNHPSVRALLETPPETGLFSSGSSTENFLRESRSTFIAQEPELFPHSPFLSLRPPRQERLPAC